MLDSLSYVIITKGLGGSHSKIEIGIDDKSDFDVLRPKGPKPPIVKKFDEFLSLLAESLGVTVQHLKDKGYRCEQQGNQIQLKIPNSDYAKQFKEMLDTGKAPKFKKQDEKDKQKDADLIFNPTPRPGRDPFKF